jgi:integrase
VARRSPNEGSFRLRKDGRWEARAVLTGPDGVRRSRSLLGRTHAEVQGKLREALRAELAGQPVPPARLALAAFLDQWLADVVRPKLRPSTIRSYTGIVTTHLKPGLGRYPLARLTPQQVQAFLNTKAASGLSPRTVSYLRSVLRQALTQAERWGLVSRNVAKLAEPPRIPHAPVVPLTPAEARVFREAIHGDRLEALFLLAIGSGLRQGEILGLAWGDVDLEARTATVRQALQRVNGALVLVEPKSSSSHRIATFPAFVGDALRAYRTRQREERLLAGTRWHDDPRQLVFTTSVGTPLDGITVTRRFQAILAAAGLPRQRFHDLRHACASFLLAQGVPARVVMEQLGHSQISLTLGTYSHLIPGMSRAATDLLDDLLAPSSDAV